MVVCVCTYIYIYIYVYMYVCMYVCMYVSYRLLNDIFDFTYLLSPMRRAGHRAGDDGELGGHFVDLPSRHQDGGLLAAARVKGFKGSRGIGLGPSGSGISGFRGLRIQDFGV